MHNQVNEKYKNIKLLLYKIVNDVYKTLGAGHSESVYQNALCVDLKLNHYYYETERIIPIIYKNFCVGHGRADIIIHDPITHEPIFIMELKAINCILKRNKDNKDTNDKNNAIDIDNNNNKSILTMTGDKCVQQLKSYIDGLNIKYGCVINFPNPPIKEAEIFFYDS